MSMPHPMIGLLLCVVIFGAELVAPAAVAGQDQEQAAVSEGSELDVGFRLLYELKPVEAHAQFAVWQVSHPEDTLGSASEAAGSQRDCSP